MELGRRLFDGFLEAARSPSREGDPTGAVEPWMPGAARG
jgi:hypothetical protein